MNRVNPDITVGPGTRLQDRYTVQAPLGTGSQATVWRCVDTITDTPVAIKHASDPREWPNARREYVLLRLLALPGVVGILDEWVDRSGWFVVMPLLEGTPFPEQAGWARVRTLMRSVLSTLAAMHGRGIVHADLKADNMLVSGDTVTLIDLGFAMYGHAATDLSGFTLATAAPELWMGGKASPASDVFALARVAVGALGASPPPHPDIHKGHRALLDAVSALHMPAEDRAMLGRMLAWDPSERPSAASLVAWLGEDTGRELTIQARHRFDHTPEDMHALLGTGTVSLQWLLDAGMGTVEGDAVYFTREEVSRLELALAPRSDDPDAPPLSAVDTGDVDTVLAWCQAAVARPERLRWSLPLARWSVGHTQATGSERHLDALTLFTSLAVHSEQAQAMHDAALTVDRVAVCPVGAQCSLLLRASIAVRIQGRLDADSVLEVVGSEPAHATLEPPMTLVRVWHMRRDMGALRSWLEAELEREEDAWKVGRLLTWLSVVAYQQQDYDAGLAAIERKRGMGVELTLSDLGNELSVLLESGRHDDVVQRAPHQMRLAVRHRFAVFEVAAYAQLRSAKYRLDEVQTVDASFPTAAAAVSYWLGGVAGLAEAAIAFRRREKVAAELAMAAATCFGAAGAPSLVALLRALAAASSRNSNLAEVISTELPENGKGSIRAQTLALCRLAGVNIPDSRILRCIVSGRGAWRRRREVLSISECVGQQEVFRSGDGAGRTADYGAA